MQKEKKVKLLIVTQKVDKNDPILGFFHRWIVEFAKHFESITVICLFKGEYNLPSNVKVLSLGKEEGGSHIRKILRYIVRFYGYIWRERKNYDSVFVHMNQEYVLFGGLLWKLFDKKLTMWRNHHFGNIFTRVAVALCDKVFCTSQYSFTAQFKKTEIMPVGIDTKLFFRDESIPRIQNSILFLGRISPVKNVDIFIDALKNLDDKGVVFVANIYGDATEKDMKYYKKIRRTALSLEKKGRLVFHPAVPNTETPSIYNKHELYVNTTGSGSFDKTILEAMASECLVVASNETLKNVLPRQFLSKDKDAADLAEKIKRAMSITEYEKKEYKRNLYQYAMGHDLSGLVRLVLSLLTRKPPIRANLF